MAVRARQARELFQLLGSDAPHPRIQHLIESICEEQHRLQQSLAECVGMMQMMINQLEGMTLVGENMKAQLMAVKNNQEDPAPDLGSVTK